MKTSPDRGCIYITGWNSFTFFCLIFLFGRCNKEQLETLYFNFDNNPNRVKRIPDYFSNEYSDNPEPGDIILFQKKKDRIIWHVAILSAININDGLIEYIDMLGDKVYMNDIIYNKEYQDNLLFIKPENLLKPISPNSVRNKIKYATYEKILLRKFLVNNYFKPPKI